MNVLVGPDGRVWNPYGYEFVRYLGYMGRDVNLAAYAIRNLGFAGLMIFPRYTRVLVKPSLFPMPCFERVLELLLRQEPHRTVLEQVGRAHTPLEVIISLDDVFARLRHFQLATPEETHAPNIMQLSLARLSRAKRSGMQAALLAWRAAQGYVATHDIQKVANDPVFGGGALAWLPNKDRCVIEAWPKTYSQFDKSGYERFHGTDIRDLPDSKYLMPTTRSYFNAAHEQAPYLELVEAVLTLENGSRYWGRYERLLLPWRTRGSDIFITSVPRIRLVSPC